MNYRTYLLIPHSGAFVFGNDKRITLEMCAKVMPEVVKYAPLCFWWTSPSVELPLYQHVHVPLTST